MSTKVTKVMRTETAHRLAGHPGRCKFIHGHSYKWEVTLKGKIQSDGILVDFSQLKKIMTQVIDPFDHSLVLEENDYILPILITGGITERVMAVHYRPTAENMAHHVACCIDHCFEGQFKVTVKLWETETSFAEATA